MYDSLAIGVVVAAYPEGPAVDVLIIDDGRRLRGVQVMVPAGSSSTGVLDLVDIGGPADDSRWDIKADREKNMRAVVAFYRSEPIVIGFLLPAINQVTFKEKNRRIMRHASDVYTSIDDAGNIEVFHPSGTYLRIGETAAHEDLTAKDFDQQWKITRNTGKAVHVHMSVKNAGVEKASLNIDPSGAIAVSTVASATVTAPSVTVDSPQSTFTGHVTIQDGLAVSGGTGAAATFAGNVQVTGGDVTADGKSLKTHVHSGVTPGGANTGMPV